MSLYVKHRPDNLDSIIGNSSTIKSLKQLIKSGNLPKTIMFCGPSGCGKTTLARILKNELKCAEMDFTELNVANTRGIDTIRDVIQFSQFVAFGGGTKIFLFDEAHKLTNDAQNALLKILEDTPQNVYFILCTTDPQKLIETIRNRCAIFPVTALTMAQLVSLLKNICKKESKTVAEDVLKAIAQLATGSPRQALLTLDQVIDLEPEQALEIIREIEIGEVQVIELCRALVKKPKPNWEELTGLLKKMEIAEPEKARVAIMGYLASTLLNTGRESVGKMMEHFSQPFINSGRGGLVLALWRACQ